MAEDSEDSQGCKLIILGLAFATNAIKLKEYAEKYGKVSEHQIILDKATGKSRGFGFVTFSQKADADAFLEEESHFLDGRTLSPKLAVSREKMSTSRQQKAADNPRIFVAKIGHDVQTGQ